MNREMKSSESQDNSTDTFRKIVYSKRASERSNINYLRASVWQFTPMEKRKKRTKTP